MPVTTLVSPEEYMQTVYHPDREYADGVLVGRNAGTQLHSLLQMIIAAYLYQFQRKFHFKVLPECRLRMGDRRYVIPDVMIVEEPFTRGKVITDVPAVVFEIQSPDDKLDDVFQKCLQYSIIGVQNIIVLDPKCQRAYVFADQAMQVVTSIILHLPKSGTDLPLPVAAMFAELTED